MKPLVGYGTSLDDLSLFEPDEHGQSRWQYSSELTVDNPRRVSFSHRFEKDSAFVVLRVPYTLGYQQKYIGSLPKRKGVEVIKIGESAKGNPLTLIKISRGEEQSEKENPCILIYAREHCDEPDSSWAAQGALRFLLGDSAEANALRDQFTFIIIPMIDPDGFAAARHENVCLTFWRTKATTESRIYAAWFENWVRQGKRLDLALNLHNPEPRDYPNAMGLYMENSRGRMTEIAALNATILQQLDPRFPTKILPGPRWITTCLGGWLGYYYGALPILYEVNSQCSSSRLSLDELRDVGRRLVLGACAHLQSERGKRLLASISEYRSGLEARLSEYPSSMEIGAIETAYQLKWNILNTIPPENTAVMGPKVPQPKTEER
jgi:hypothetical protein